MEEQRLLPELHPALDRALRQPPVLVEPWEAGTLLSSIGEGLGLLLLLSRFSRV